MAWMCRVCEDHMCGYSEHAIIYIMVITGAINRAPTQRATVCSGYELRDGHDMIYSINIVETGDVFCPFYNQWRVVQI